MIDAIRFATTLRPLIFSRCRFEEMFLLQGVEVASADPSWIELSGESELGVSKFAALTLSFLRNLHASSAVRYSVQVTPLAVGVIIRLRWESMGIPDTSRLPTTASRPYLYGSVRGRNPRSVRPRRKPRGNRPPSPQQPVPQETVR